MKNKPKSRNYYHFIMIGCITLFIVLGIRIIYMGAGPGSEKWREIAQTFYRTKLDTISPIRGTIFSDDGTPLSITAPYYRMTFDFQHQALGQVTPDSLHKELNLFANLLIKEFGSHDASINKKRLLRRWYKGIEKKSRYTIVIPKPISYMQYKEMLTMEPLCMQPNKRGKRVRKSILRKIMAIENVSRRTTPFGSLASRTIGSVYGSVKDHLSQGKAGLEEGYNDILKGKCGVAEHRYIGDRYSDKIIKPKQDGASLYTTLDMNIQAITESALKDEMSKINAGSGSAIVMQVKTGRILAITNLQRIDSGRYAETRNYAVSDLSEPGSTFKVASMVVALDEGKIHPNDIVDVGNGVWKVYDKSVKDYNHGRGFGKITASEVIQYSSNVGMAKIIWNAYKDDPAHYVDCIRKLGFGLDLKLKIPGYAKAVVRKPSDNPRRWYGTTLAWMSFGYETQIPPIYTLAFYNAIANGGKYMRPYFVDRAVLKGKVILVNKPQVLIPSICKPSTLREIKDMLRLVVEKGTGKHLLNNVVDISGKSGTAQISQGNSGYHGHSGIMYMVSFCAFFPSEDPEYSAIVVIRDPSSRFHAGGGAMAGPVVRDIATAIYSQKKVLTLDSLPRLDEKQLRNPDIIGLRGSVYPLLMHLNVTHLKDSNNKYTPVDISFGEFNKPTITPLPIYLRGVVPNVVGMSVSDAVYLLMKNGYRPEVTGYGWVRSQSVAAGKKLPMGRIVKLKLEPQ